MALNISIHKALAGLDIVTAHLCRKTVFISIHKALAGLDGITYIPDSENTLISSHKALAGLDWWIFTPAYRKRYFNPQGPRGPRRGAAAEFEQAYIISIHKALAGLDRQVQVANEDI